MIKFVLIGRIIEPTANSSIDKTNTFLLPMLSPMYENKKRLTNAPK